MSEVPKFIKEFSKENAPEERAEVGQEIWAKRSEYFRAKNDIIIRIEELTKAAEEKIKQAEQIVSEIKEIETELSERMASSAQRFLSFFRIKELEKTLSVKNSNKQNILLEYTEIQEILGELELQKLDTTALDEARARLSDFYAQQEDAWQEYEHEKEIRDVANIMRDNDVVFIHSIKEGFVPGDNSLLQENTSWKLKLDIALAMSPVLSTSTIKEGDTREKMWGGMGVILKGGSVQRAFSSDASTIAKGKNQRLIFDEATMPIDQEIGQVLETDSGRYNEFVVEQPQVAGYYVCIDQSDGMMRSIQHDMARLDDILSATGKLEMPLYVIESGLVYEAVCVPEGIDNSDAPPRKIPPHLIKGKRIEVQDIIDNNFEISDQEKDVLRERLFKNSPFKIKTPEVDLVNSRSNGMQFYQESEAIDLDASLELEGDFSELKRLIYQQGFRAGIKGEPEIKVLNQVFGVTWDTHYVLIAGMKYRVFENKLTEELRICSERDYSQFRKQSLDLGYLTIDVTNEKIDAGMGDNNGYIKGMTDLVLRLKGENSSYDKVRLQKIAFHLFGFAEAARVNNDHVIADQAVKLAESVFSEKDYQELIVRRFDREGNFLITEEDLN